MPLYAACDLHSNNTVLAVLDEAGSLKLRQRVPNDLDLIGAALAPFRDQLQGVAVESTAAHGLEPDYVEAMAFAWLERETLAGRPGNLPAVTGARGPRVLGVVHPA